MDNEQQSEIRFRPVATERSEEVQEIISHIPGWIVRSGITLIFFIFLVLLFVSWFVRYPDMLQADVTITTSPPPLTLVTRTAGNLILLKREHDAVRRGEAVACIQSTTDFDDLLELERLLAARTPSTGNLSLPLLTLGELQSYYADFLKAMEDRALYGTVNPFVRQIAQITKQLASYRQLKKSLQAKYALVREKLALAQKRFERDSILNKQGVIAPLGYEDAKTRYLEQKQDFQSAAESITANEIQIDLLQKEKVTLEIQQAEEESEINRAVENARQELLARIAKWKETFVLTAGMRGHLACLGFRENGAFVEAGEELFSVIPDSDKLYARAELPISGSGKVKTGQKVNIQLDNFPSEQFGMLRGTVHEISAVPAENKYYVNIRLDGALMTTYHKTLPFRQQLTGKTEIITEDLRLLERIFYRFRSLVRQRG